MQLLRYLRTKPNKVEEPTFTTSRAPRVPTRYDTPEDRKKIALVRLAQQYRDSVIAVLRQFRIGARIKTWKVAPRYLMIGLRLTDPTKTTLAMSDRVLSSIAHAACLGVGSKEPPVEAIMIADMIVYQFRLPEYLRMGRFRIRLWEDIQLDNPYLQGGIGLTLNDAPVIFEFDQGAPHTVVSGTTGSGKTTLLHTIVTQLAASHDPADLKLALADPKGDFLRFHDLAHLIYQPAYSYEDIETLIAYVYAEALRRTDNGITDAPRLVLVIDECDHDEIIGRESTSMKLKEIAMRGRWVHVNLIIGTHIANHASLGDLSTQLRNRFHGAAATAKDSGQVEGGLALHKLAGKGDFYHLIGGEKARFQGASTRPEDVDNLPKDRNIQPVPGDLPNLPPNHLVDPDRNPPHRPRIEPEAQYVAYYLYHTPDRVTRSEAETILKLTRTGHERNQAFAKDVAKWLALLKETGGKWPQE